MHGDHGYEDQVERMFQAAFDAFGRIDILMNNASVDASGTYVADLKIEDFEATLRSNLIGQLICSKHFINHRKQAGGGGKIINTRQCTRSSPAPGRRTTTARRARCATSPAPWSSRSPRWG